MQEIDRVAVILRPTQVMLDWLKTLPEIDKDITLSDVRKDSTVILIPIFEDEMEMWDYFHSYYEAIFISELFAWVQNEQYWPQDRSFFTFKQWFEIESHSLVYDLASDDEDDDELELEDEDSEMPPSIERYN